ncbi:ferrochelatase [Tistrella bauzanensis]|uniref:ferrochelatase n=1 Tax=Tistrella TaxID=171436 RepID=UPI0031F6C9C1
MIQERDNSETGRIAILLFNLGGPDGPDAVRPFLFNLFNDPAIIGAPALIRWAIATLISRRRAPFARQNYALMGGGSPLLPETQAQARALEADLAGRGMTVKTWPVMRYWHPFADRVAAEVKAWSPDRIVALPLYPQYSTSTSASSLKDWAKAARRAGLDVPTTTLCCYPQQPGLIRAHAELIAERWRQAETGADGGPARPVRLLLSAHGLPKKIIERGDPYQWQVEQSCAAIVAALAPLIGRSGPDDLDWQVCYQSRVGPLEWIGPSTDAEVERAGHDGRALIVVPVAFVSEHVETLVELDIEYRELAEKAGAMPYYRVPTPSVHPAFIGGLGDLVVQGLDRLTASGGRPVAPDVAGTGCPASFSQCACRAARLSHA